MQLNLDFQNNFFKTICWILSVLSWLLFIITNWIGFFNLIIKKYDHNISFNNVWSFINNYIKDNKDKNTYYLPLQSHRVFYIILFAILLILGTVGFFLYLMNSTWQKDEHVFEGMMGTYSRYHFIPLICASALFIVGINRKISFDEIGIEPTALIVDEALKTFNNFLSGFAINLAFSVIGLCTLVFVKMKTKIERPFYIVYFIKDGVYSCLLTLFTYNIFYSGIYTGVFGKMRRGFNIFKDNPLNNLEMINIISSIDGFMKDCGITFSIIIGTINLGLGFFFKDICIPIMNFIIYIGLTIYFFSIKEKNRDNNGVSVADGIIDLIVLILSTLTIGFMTFNKYKEREKNVPLIQ